MTEIEKWTKAIKEASSLEGKLYARNKLREVKNVKKILSVFKTCE